MMALHSGSPSARKRRRPWGLRALSAVGLVLLFGIGLVVWGTSPVRAAGPAVSRWAGVGPMYLRPAGPITVTEPGTHLDGLEVWGCITVLADNTWISRVRVHCSGEAAAITQTNGARGMFVEDSELFGDGSVATGIWSARDYTVRGTEIAGFHDGLFVASDTVVSDNWIHGLVSSPGDHNDLIQMVGGARVRILGNRLDHGPAQTSAIFIKSDLAPIDDVTIAGNIVTGGAYSIYVMAGNAGGGCCAAPTNVTVVNNLIGAGSYLFGPMVVMGNNTVACNLLTNGAGVVYYDSDRGTGPRYNPPC